MVGARGRLVTYVGTAPGVGKTYRMLADGWSRAQAGEDVVIGWVERHGRAATRDQALRLEIVPPRTVTRRGVEFDDLDVTTIIARRPDVVLVDELALTKPAGGKRYEDVEELLDAGIDVMTTVNVANLLSVRDLAARITGAGALEAVPDEVVRAGDVVLVDLAPEALRRRIASGQVYSADGVGGALASYFARRTWCSSASSPEPGSTAASARPLRSSTERRPGGPRSSPACRARAEGRP